MKTSLPRVTGSAKAMAKSYSVNRADRESYNQELDLNPDTIEETEDISSLLCGDDWPTLLGDFESTNTPEAQDQPSPKQGITDRILVHDFDTDVCILKVSEMEPQCENPGCSQSFATRHGLL